MSGDFFFQREKHFTTLGRAEEAIKCHCLAAQKKSSSYSSFSRDFRTGLLTNGNKAGSAIMQPRSALRNKQAGKHMKLLRQHQHAAVQKGAGKIFCPSKMEGGR